MPKTEPKPKDLLADRELIGFARCHDRDGQVIQRASSAKVTEKARLREAPLVVRANSSDIRMARSTRHD